MKKSLRQSIILSTLFCAFTSSANADQVNWTSDVEGALRTANQSGQLVLMKFTADWCGYCKKMERETFTRPAVASIVNQKFVPVLVDADRHKQLVRHLKIDSLPFTLVVSPQMVILSRVKGYQTESKLMPILQQVVAKHSQTTPTQVAAAPQQPPATHQISQTAAWPSAEPTVATAQPVQPQASPPAFGGLCLPSVNESRSLISGTPQFSLKYHGKTLYFRDGEQMQKFRSKPDSFWPMYDGNCPVTQAEDGQSVEGKLEFAAMFRGKLWLSSSPEQMQKFVKRPTTYANALKQQ